MKAIEQYNRANYLGIELISTCVSSTKYEWDKFMNGAKKANGKRIRQLIKKHFTRLVS